VDCFIPRGFKGSTAKRTWKEIVFIARNCGLRWPKLNKYIKKYDVDQRKVDELNV